MDTGTWDSVLAALEQDPNDGRAIGWLLQEIRNEDSAEPLIQSVLDLALRTRRGADLLSVIAHQCYQHGEYETCETAWRCYLELRPDDANAQFNHALALRSAGHWQRALELFRNLADKGSAAKADCWVNCGNIQRELRRYEEAISDYQRALRVHDDHPLALLNLALVYEERGDRHRAEALYGSLLENDPRHPVALTNLTYMRRIESSDDQLLRKLRRYARYADRTFDDALVLFALGKALDDLGSWKDAFATYERANRIASVHDGEFDRAAYSDRVDTIIRRSRDRAIPNRRRGVFVCGMFRSGSTLLERILGAHPRLVPGGEMRFFTTSDSAVAEDYLDYVSERFPDEDRIVIDKSPENLLHVGRILTAFPEARILITDRHPLDVILSNYFQPFAPGRPWSTDLHHIVHVHRQYRRLSQHWLKLFPENVLSVRYESLVKDTQTTIKACLEFLGLPWDSSCVDFAGSDNPVNTGSLWQVRQPLYERSIGRWKHYREGLGEIEAEMSEESFVYDSMLRQPAVSDGQG